MSFARSSVLHIGAENPNPLQVNHSDSQPFPFCHTAHAGVNLRVDYGKHYHVCGGVWFYLIISVSPGEGRKFKISYYSQAASSLNVCFMIK